ncbi:hypothetical protein BJ875DRAFT_478517 [Amylocarpus encephaloides]|uniref:BHLH domain-containing protein n=1 Tax=Amylocarpus encephaloides TaxID=45428 RepID=A0A9P7Y7H0_9HELO|nr:hypothetical protein BJ875DRAFT_478517 [Amylocarpus encephaloides]
MPFNTEYLTSADEPFSFVSSMGFDGPQNGIVDQLFSDDVDTDHQWQNWMEWNRYNDIDILHPLRRQQTFGAISEVDAWSADMESVGDEARSASLINGVNGDYFPFRRGGFAMGPGTLLPSMLRIRQEVEQSTKLYPALTEAEVRALQAIALPYRPMSQADADVDGTLTTMVSDSSFVTPTPSPESDARSRKNKKRKSITGANLAIDTCQSRERGHNAIEKRYRTNLNDKINCLRDSVPTLSTSDSKAGDDVVEDSDAQVDGKRQKYGKAAILMRALEYIQLLEGTTKRLGGDVDSLKLRVGAFEKLAMSGNKIASRTLSMANDVPVKNETLESIQSRKDSVSLSSS